jgi:shikimate dehydrogenase
VRRAGVLGSPIAHSLSPALHRAAYSALRLDWAYDAYEVDEAGLPAFFAELDERWAGLSLTMPLKSAVIPFLDMVDEVAGLITSVNTVLPGKGGWRGTNTDVFGIVRSLTCRGVSAPRQATVLGAGATARSAIAALAELSVREVMIVARRPEAADELLRLAGQFGLTGRSESFEPNADLLGSDVVISTLPGSAAGPWAACAIDAPGMLLDASYHPWPTPLAAAWPSDRVASGRDMLLWQAVRQVELMTGQSAPVEAMAAALPPLSTGTG